MSTEELPANAATPGEAAASGSACPNHPDVAEGLVECARCGTRFCGDCLVELGGQPHCAQCKAERVRDLKAGIDPDALPLASLNRRSLSYILDICVIIVPYGVLLAIASLFVSESFNALTGNEEDFVLAVVFYGGPFSIVFVYQSLMVQYKGQTVGMMALKTKVVTPEGNDVSAWQAWLRGFVTALLFFAYGNTLDGVFAHFTKERKCLHDFAARTRVFDLRQ